MIYLFLYSNCKRCKKKGCHNFDINTDFKIPKLVLAIMLCNRKSFCNLIDDNEKYRRKYLIHQDTGTYSKALTVLSSLYNLFCFIYLVLFPSYNLLVYFGIPI